MKVFVHTIFILLVGQATVAAQEVRKEALEFSPSFNPINIVDDLRPAIISQGQSFDSTIKLGFYAHEVKKVWPLLVYQRQTKVQTGKNSYTEKTVDVVDLDQLIPLLVMAIQKQEQEIQSLRVQIATLKGTE